MEKLVLQQLFRCLQYNFILANQVICYLMPLISMQGIFETITALYCAITFEHSIHFLPVISTLLIVSLLFLIAFKVASSLGLTITNLSIAIPKSYLMNEERLPKRSKMFYKSCRPFVFRFANLVPIERSVYLVYINDIIALNLINLLVTFNTQ